MEKFKKIISVVIIILLVPILFVGAVILVDSYVNPDKIPSFFGWKPFIVLSDSMKQEIMPGDIAVVKEVNTDSLKEGDIIASKEGDVVIIHRISEIVQDDGNKKFITKVDNYPDETLESASPTQIEGIYKYRIPRLGNVAMFIQTPMGMIICLSIPLIILIIVQITESRRDKRFIEQTNEKQKNMEEEIKKLKKQNKELMKK